jgi:hypothetical protein
MTRAVFLAAVVLALGACSSLCPDGYKYVSGDGTYGFAKCEKETE